MTRRMTFAFWKTVADCLVEFFDMDPQRASELVLGLYDRTVKEIDAPKKSGRDSIYHAEPIHIAADLAGREPDRNALFYTNYRRIQNRNLKRLRGMSISSETDVPAILSSAIRKSTVPQRLPQAVDKVADRPKRLVATRLLNTR